MKRQTTRWLWGALVVALVNAMVYLMLSSGQAQL